MDVRLQCCFLRKWPNANDCFSAAHILLLYDLGAATGLISMWYDLKQSQSLTGWTQNASNPCGQQWYGVVCDGSSVTEM